MSVALLLAWLSPEPPALFPSVSFLYRPHVSLSPSSGFSRLNTASPMWLSSQIISSDVCCLQFPVVLFMLVFESFSPSILSLLSLLHRDSPAYSSSRSQSFLISIISTSSGFPDSPAASWRFLVTSYLGVQLSTVSHGLTGQSVLLWSSYGLPSSVDTAGTDQSMQGGTGALYLSTAAGNLSSHTNSHIDSRKKMKL